MEAFLELSDSEISSVLEGKRRMDGILNDQVGLRTFSDGEGPTIIFIHGWPDDHTLWDNQVAHLKNRFRCVTVDLPGFGADDRGVEKWGYTSDEVVKRIETTVLKEGKGEPIVLVAHDWGCFYSYKFEAKRPELVRKMVTIDVGGSMKPGVIGGIILITYQLWLAAAFLIGPPIGDVVARFIARISSAPSGARMARASTCYPYYDIWKKILFSGQKVKAMYPKCPLMFVHGCAGFKKMLSFHADKWADNVSKKEGSCVAPIAKASHWVMRDQSDELNRKLDEFLADM